MGHWRRRRRSAQRRLATIRLDHGLALRQVCRVLLRSHPLFHSCRCGWQRPVGIVLLWLDHGLQAFGCMQLCLRLLLLVLLLLLLVIFDSITVFLRIGRNQANGTLGLSVLFVVDAMVSLKQVPSRERSTAETSKRFFLGICSSHTHTHIHGQQTILPCTST